MSFLSDFETSLNTTFDDINKSQSESMAVQISANYIAGKTAAEKHKSFRSSEPEDPEEEDPENQLTTEEKAEIAVITALFLGYLKTFNNVTQSQILTQVKEIIKDGENKQPEGKPIQLETKKEIKQYLNDVFTGKTTITIDNTGKKKKEMYVDKNLQISEVTRTVTRPYQTSLNSYASTIAENAAHRAYEGGRKAYYKLQGYGKWVFVGPSDERARPWHVALLGNVYTYGTAQSNYAEHCLHEPRCRHRADVFYDDPEKDVSKEDWQKLKDEAGLHWDEKEERWAIKDNIKIPKSPKTKPETKVPKPVKETPKKEQKVGPKKTPEEVEKVIRDKENEIKDRKTEKAYIFDKNGKVLLEKVGDQSSVSFTKPEQKLFNGNVFTHNHPDTGGSFSPNDIYTACYHGAKEVRVVDKGASYTLKLKNGGNFSQELWNSKINDSYLKNREIVANDFADKIRAGKMSIDKVDPIMENRIWTRVAGEVKELDYKMTLIE